MPKLLAAFPAAVTSFAAQAADLDKDTSVWRGHIKVLASDRMQGRLTSSPGYRVAAEHVARTFELPGLKPAGSEGHFQKVEFEVQTSSQRRGITPGRFLANTKWGRKIAIQHGLDTLESAAKVLVP